MRVQLRPTWEEEKKHNRNEKQLIVDSIKLLYCKSGGKKYNNLNCFFFYSKLCFKMLPLNGALHLVCVAVIVVVSCALFTIKCNRIRGVCMSPLHDTLNSILNFPYILCTCTREPIQEKKTSTEIADL